MLDRLTSTWAILVFLLAVLIVASFLPTGPTINATESIRPAITLDGDVLNQDLSAAGAVNPMTQAN